MGVRAIEQGFGVAFYRLEDLLHEMRKDAAVSPSALRRKKYFNVSYLVVDEVGFEPMSREDASLFFRLVSYRYRRGSTAITTNKSVKDWPGILAGDEAMAAAILDRLLHHSTTINIRGESYRLKERRKAGLFPRAEEETRPAPFPSSAIVENGPRRQGSASPRKSSAPLTAPGRSGEDS